MSHASCRVLASLVTFILISGCGGEVPMDPGGEAVGGSGVMAVLIDPSGSTLVVGDTLRLTAMAVDGYGNPVPGINEFEWTSSDPSVAFLAGDGVVAADSVGQVTISARVSGKRGESEISVSNRRVHSISLKPSEAKLQVGDTLRLVATARDSEGEDIPDARFDWISSDELAAKVTGGLVQGTGAGSPIVTAQVGSVEASASLTVEGPPPPPPGTMVAFPGAEGYGALALSECSRSNMEALFVTNLEDSGSGSLRDAIRRARSDRLSVVIFRTGGTIRLKSALDIDKACLYIAGQTAPGDGIQLDGKPGLVMAFPRDGSPRDIAVRYLRMRSGRGDPGKKDVVSIVSGRRLIFDHISTQWGNDENFSIHTVQYDAGGEPATDITLQRSIFAQGLRPHSTGSLIVYRPDRAPPIERVSVHHNLYAHNAHRNPRIGATKSIEVVNNVVYNWRNRAGGMHDGAVIDYIGNYFKAGPWDPAGSRILEHYPGELSRLYMRDNVAIPQRPDPGSDQRKLVTYDSRENYRALPSSAFRSQPLGSPVVPVTATSASEALASVLGDVGANRRLECDGSWTDVRDRVDEQIRRDVRDGTGPSSDGQADHESDYGGLPSLSAGSPCADSDGDGMPDAFESRYGLDPNDPSDAKLDSDGDGYTNLEEYLNGTSPR